jgi:hypothetical protein
MARELDNPAVIKRAREAIADLLISVQRQASAPPAVETFRVQDDGSILLPDGSRIPAPATAERKEAA